MISVPQKERDLRIVDDLFNKSLVASQHRTTNVSLVFSDSLAQDALALCFCFIIYHLTALNI